MQTSLIITQISVAPSHARNSSCPCSTTHMKWPAMAATRWLVSCQAVCQQFFLPTLAFKATDFCQLLKNIIAFPDLLLAAAAATDGRGHLRRDMSSALDALACAWVDCLDAFRLARPAKL
eukprot:351814-Chlamydomonas_euryale.AAC.2